MKEVKSRTLMLKNALVTLHEYSAGTAILHVVDRASGQNRASIWVNTADELNALAGLLLTFRGELVE